MKKITSVILVLVLALLLPCFAACNESGDTTTTPDATTPADETTPAPADTTANPDAPVTNADGSCRHAKISAWENTGKYTCTGLVTMTRSCQHCDFVEIKYEDDGTGNVGEHVLSDDIVCSFPGSANTAAFDIKNCSFCQAEVRINKEATNTRKNLIVVTPEMYESAGFSNVTDYLKSEHGTHIHKNKGKSDDWGHIGYSGAHGTAAIYDSFREATVTTDSSVMYWNLKEIEPYYTANGVKAEEATDPTAVKYCALVGINFYEKTTISGFALFVESQNEIEFDVLGGTKNADGTTSWKVLGSSNGTYNAYDESTSFTLGDFEAADVDCIQIGITQSYSNIVVISEIEIYG